ncbi:MAG: iron-sulfur cluster assembly scaffold protein [Desulfobacterales bacterium]|nr:iron-sulfur cluster assembly scaffold protein [Desulfobacterales bacterium]
MTDEEEYSSFDDMVKDLEERIRKDEKELYGGKMVEEALNPKNIGELKSPDGAARMTDSHGDTMQIHLKVEGETISDCKFITDARGPTVAFGSVITELVKGKTIEEALKIEANDIVSVLGGLPKDDEHTPELAVNTLRAALEDYKKKL